MKNYSVDGAMENETVGKKIRIAELQKVPYVIVVGDAEKNNQTVRLRERGKGDLGEMKINALRQLVGGS